MDKDWLIIYQRVRQVLLQGRGKSVFPATRFDVVHKAYQNDPAVNILDLLIVIDHQMDDDGAPPALLLGWLKKTFLQKKRLVNEYSFITQREATGQESPAAYALGCRIFLKAGETATAQKLYHHLLYMRVRSEKSRFYGGYADLRTGECFSFDNLQALISMREWTGIMSPAGRH